MSPYRLHPPPSRSAEGPFARVLSKVERERFPRAALRPAPGRLRASFTPVLRPVREVQSLDWDRRRRVTPAGSTSQEAWPGVEPGRLKTSGESRGGAPEGERLRRAAAVLGTSAANGWMRLAALRLPPFWSEGLGRAFLQWRGTTRARRCVARTWRLARVFIPSS